MAYDDVSQIIRESTITSTMTAIKQQTESTVLDLAERTTHTK